MFGSKKVVRQKDRMHGSWRTSMTMLLPALGFGLMMSGIARQGRHEGSVMVAGMFAAGDDFDVQRPYSAAMKTRRSKLRGI